MANKPWHPDQQAMRAVLKQIRVEAELSQVDLAKLLVKPQSYVSKYESGERKLGYLEVKEICLKCGTTITKFDNKLSKLL